jgi:hypothetical protein
VLFPDPEGPTMAVTLPTSNVTFKPSRICTLGLLGYEKATFSRRISALADTSGSFKPEMSGVSASIVLNNSVAADAALAIAIIGLASLPMLMTAIITEKRTLHY